MCACGGNRGGGGGSALLLSMLMTLLVVLTVMHSSYNTGITSSITELDLGPVFDIEDLSNPFQQLGARGCLPANFDVGNGTVASIIACSQAVGPIETRCDGTPRMGYYYQCLQKGYVWAQMTLLTMILYAACTKMRQ